MTDTKIALPPSHKYKKFIVHVKNSVHSVLLPFCTLGAPQRNVVNDGCGVSGFNA